ncbi:deoxyguanosinetriphosphate triphosphohydrolase [Sphingomonas sp. ID0503]|uniref:deoxyguanosinetriphosphate triphosphohydrolase n=1 Tax=Sphingomonas sp. ID0503 TaxID=3399691 RepID=UPI003AFA38EB
MPAPYASNPAQSRGRLHATPGAGSRGPRDAFQRDRDRIIHCISFRRLAHKTQVFVAPDDDHFRVRLTHSLEVAQIGRTIARALGLNEDLTEALCLAHDIGHPPFGHSGEEALHPAFADVGGFDHNAHTLRVLTEIEAPYPGWRGLNLTWDTLEGLAKHNGPVASPTWAMVEADRAFPLDLDSWPSIEAQVAALADDIAYDNHDMDDGLRAGLLDLDMLVAQPLVAGSWAAVTARFPHLDRAHLIGEFVREQIGVMVNDLLAGTERRIAELGIRTPDDARAAGQPVAAFSPALAEQERAFKRFMYANLYHHPHQIGVAAQAQRVIANLADAYRADPTLLPAEWQARLPAEEPWRGRHIADFIAGMTDRYALSRHRELIGPVELPGGFA